MRFLKLSSVQYAKCYYSYSNLDSISDCCIRNEFLGVFSVSLLKEYSFYIRYKCLNYHTGSYYIESIFSALILKKTWLVEEGKWNSALGPFATLSWGHLCHTTVFGWMTIASASARTGRAETLCGSSVCSEWTRQAASEFRGKGGRSQSCLHIIYLNLNIKLR